MDMQIILLITTMLALAIVGVALLKISRRINQPANSDNESIIKAFKEESERIERAFRYETDTVHKGAEERGQRLRQEVGTKIQEFGDSLQKLVGELGKDQDKRSKDFANELIGTLKDTTETMLKRVNEISESNERRQVELRQTVEGQLEKLREDNTRKLAEMQRTVDEKLEGTLEKRLGESFKMVSDRLEQVHQGLGEMQTLATGVGDLKRVLTNVKTRGTWAEVQLGALLEEMMSPDQYLKNAKVDPNSREIVEYAVRLPGQDADSEVLLPIDAKFPQEDFERLMDAIDNADRQAIESAQKSLEIRIKDEAKRISSKYIIPPRTTDFAILFLPTEGLFAEAIRMPGLVSELQRKFRIVIAGPTTLSALLNSLRMGFHTLAIQKRTSDVWKVLMEATEEFRKYGDTWDMVKKQLATVSNTVEKVGTRTRAVERKLRDVKSLETTGLIADATEATGNKDEEENAIL